MEKMTAGKRPTSAITGRAVMIALTVSCLAWAILGVAAYELAHIAARF